MKEQWEQELAKHDGPGVDIVRNYKEPLPPVRSQKLYVGPPKEAKMLKPTGWKTYTITQEQMDKMVGAAHSGGMLGGDAAYGACLTVGAILAEIAYKAGVDKSPGSAPEDDAPVSRS